MQTKTIRTLGLIAIILVLILSLGSAGAQDMKVLRVWLATDDVPTLDGTDGTDTTSIALHRELFPGLTRTHEITLETEPAMATWEVSDDGLTYTFHILENVPWVKYNPDTDAVEQVMDADGNVLYVTSNDFRFGMLRSMDPREGSYYGSILAGWISGGAELNAATEADDMAITEMKDAVQINVIDDYTLEVVTSERAAFVSALLGMWMSAAQPSWLIEEVGGDVWYTGENIETYGPFALKEWLAGEQVTLVKNPYWPGTETVPAPAIDEIDFMILDESAALANYEAGLLDVGYLPTTELDRVRADPVLSQELQFITSPCSFYIAFNQSRPPFDDVRVRRAFAMSINRQAIIDNILKDGRSPAYFFSNPVLAAAPTIEQYPDQVITEDVPAAQSLIEEYMGDMGDMAGITYMTTASETSGLIGAAFQQMWSDNIGVNVEIQQQEWAVFLDSTRKENIDTAPSMWPLGWCQDYPDTHNFLFDVWHSSVQDRAIAWQSDEFDSLLEQAKVEQDQDVRRDLYAQAEYILTNQDVVIVPTYFSATRTLTKPYVERTYGLDGQRYEKWDISN